MKLLRYILIIVFACISAFNFAQITFIADTTSGCEPLLVSFQFSDSSSIDTVKSVFWDFGNGDTITKKDPSPVLYDSAGTFSVSIIVNGNTTVSKTDLISVLPSPDAGFIYSDTIELGTYAVVFQNINQRVDSLGYYYQWDLSDGTKGDSRILVHTFTAEGIYGARLIVTNSLGCTDTSSRAVEVRDTLEMPNVFTPNQDGVNDYFIVKSNGKTVYSIEIFSKTGTLVYRTQAPIIIWDGRNMSGQELSPGTYFFIIKPVNSSSPYKKSGFVELFR